MTANDYRRIPHVSWGFRSLMAATSLALCALLTAFSAAASVERAALAEAQERAIADEAELIAGFADYLAARTATANDALRAPSLKPRRATAESALDDAWAAALVNLDFDYFSNAEIRSSEHRCLAQAIYYEARSESRVGQAAVADVVLNRVASGIYPNTICDVVFQGHERKTGCQFSFTCDGSMKARINARLWRESELMAAAIMSGMRLPVTRSATHYHADYVSPPWARKLTPTAVIGKHLFYRFPSRRISAAAPASM